MTEALEMVAAERARQLTMWKASHDDEHRDGELAWAAAVYAAPEAIYKERRMLSGIFFEDAFPRDWNRPAQASPRVRLLVKAAALILAEIERLERLG